MTDPISTEAFTHSAREFCAWAEAAPDPDRDLSIALQLLPSLYVAAFKLPEVEPSADPYSGNPTREKSRQIYERFGALPFNYYFEVYDPISDAGDEMPEAVTGDLADDLMDIYVDLKLGLSILESGRGSDAVYYWRTSFGFHWGRHLTSAFRALHCWATKN